MTDEIESREDILIARILDGESCHDDLRDLFALAAADASLWDRFEAARRDRDAFALAVDEALSVADRVAAPVHSPAASAPLRFAGWTGWAAAAAIVLAWSWFGRLPLPNSGPVGPAVQPASLSADAALAAYIERSTAENRFIRELPQLLIEARPTADGQGTEVTYMRQFLERAVVNDLFELSTDESGRPGAVRVSNPVNTRSVLY